MRCRWAGGRHSVCGGRGARRGGRSNCLLVCRLGVAHAQLHPARLLALTRAPVVLCVAQTYADEDEDGNEIRLGSGDEAGGSGAPRTAAEAQARSSRRATAKKTVKDRNRCARLAHGAGPPAEGSTPLGSVGRTCLARGTPLPQLLLPAAHCSSPRLPLPLPILPAAPCRPCRQARRASAEQEALAKKELKRQRAQLERLDALRAQLEAEEEEGERRRLRRQVP